MTATPEPDLKTLFKAAEENFGEAFNRNDKGKITDANEGFWASLYYEHTRLLWSQLSQCFWRYSPQHGIYVPLSKAIVQNQIGGLMRKLCAGEVRSGKALVMKSLGGIVAQVIGYATPLDIMGRQLFDPFEAAPKGVILVKNGRLELHADGKHTFTEEVGRREDLSRAVLAAEYDEKAVAVKFERWLDRIFQSRRGDIDATAKAYGVALSGACRYRRILIFQGPTRRGKAQIALVLEFLITPEKFVSFERGNLGGRFENSKFLGKSVIFADDIPADFFSGPKADTFKALVGLTRLATELKSSHGTVYVYGDKLIICTTNHDLKISLGKDYDAWRDRIVIVRADGPGYFNSEESSDKNVPDKDKNDPFFAENVWQAESAGILNFALRGYRQVREDGDWLRSPEQLQRADEILKDSDSIASYVSSEFERGEGDDNVTKGEAWSEYVEYCKIKSIEPWPEKTFRGKITATVLRIFGVSECHDVRRGNSVQRGWDKLRIKTLVAKRDKATANV